ncbi:nuclear transport factor 2 family protein [Nocardioides marmoribigeumensis]|uniref:Ketosteroid isomerase-like protein n=1 Tax=Nocardioides marmoribigeumensis TaxID=433649 RepID=A0ABU2BUC2_9ACTN|nr:nuclear transport factor 2 family protein [Nocardioides marmoribigeumensis]MDR7362229.1 ketosteroid isomerase-like protein [Nocardioides marmoribigeumensis]
MVPRRTSEVSDQVREIYAGLGSRDPERTARTCREDVTVHVAGSHPLSGTYVGVPAVRDLFARIEAAAGRGTFTVTGLMADDDERELLVEACVAHRGFVRTIVHRLVLCEGRLAALHEHPMDQAAENEFWRGLLPS